MSDLESKEDYLERILMLSKTSQIVRAIDISQSMNYAKSSVSIALKKLKALNYITVNESTGAINLTKDGLLIANRIYERHTILTTLLKDLGVDNENATKDACKIEHDLSAETFECLKNHFKKYHQ